MKRWEWMVLGAALLLGAALGFRASRRGAAEVPVEGAVAVSAGEAVGETAASGADARPPAEFFVEDHPLEVKPHVDGLYTIVFDRMEVAGMEKPLVFGLIATERQKDHVLARENPREYCYQVMFLGEKLPEFEPQ